MGHALRMQQGCAETARDEETLPLPLPTEVGWFALSRGYQQNKQLLDL